MVEWEKIELGSNNLIEIDYENLGAGTDPDYHFKYITLENVDNGKLLQYIDCVFASAPSRARRVVHKYDLLISTVRPNLHAHYKVDNDIFNVICSTGFCVIKTNDSILNRNFLYHLFYSKIIDRQIELIVSGSSYPAINSNDIKKLEIPLPPLPEQRRIAAVLSDMDALIAALEKLIAKKRAIKQGVMQELLTDKRRLAGFSGDWAEKKLGELCGDKLRKGQVITEKDVQTGEIPVVAGGREAAYYHNQYNRLENVITISASGVSAGFVNFWNHKIFASDCTTIERSENYDILFLYYSLLNKQKEIYLLQTGGAQPHVQPPQLQMLEIEIPLNIAEQTAIAALLSDMDAEIDALAAKLNKRKQVKQGMMHELLTGRIRLLAEGSGNGQN
ncbi:MAG: restriction endonuclease subunit S [Spirochaetota bacterium]|jgi:type I restriction enzyme S subunit|nr:restriction endonuclease subunit S [Spirochaetota bacterium]